jgi:DNA-binding transcriptional regulator YiaG
MRTLLHTEFAALLARADVQQAEFAELTGVTPRQVNNWCRGRAAVPQYAAALAVVLVDVAARNHKRLDAQSRALSGAD